MTKKFIWSAGMVLLFLSIIGVFTAFIMVWLNLAIISELACIAAFFILAFTRNH